jgi:hypothetical protein
MRALTRQGRSRSGPVACTAHHWHIRSPFTHGLGLRLRGAGWECCHCPSYLPSSGPPPGVATAVCAHLTGESERLDPVERWLDALQQA